jgi:signal transduction histidine kinase
LKAAERLAAIGETAGMIGHDIRNPLQSIIGELYLAKSDLNYLSDGEAKKSLTESILSIEEQTLYINKIVSDLQDYSKPLAPEWQETDITKIVESVMSTLDVPDNIKVCYSIQQKLPTLLLDQLFLKRILTNLALNGIQAMQDDGGQLTLDAYVISNKLTIAVSDTGVGTPERFKTKFSSLFSQPNLKGKGSD